MQYLGRHPAEFGDRDIEIMGKLIAYAEIEPPPAIPTVEVDPSTYS